MAADPSKPCGFLKLPREMRDNIYRYCGHRVDLSKGVIGVGPCGPRAVLDTAPSSALLCTSQEIRAEYLQTWSKIPGSLQVKMLQGQDPGQTITNLDLDRIILHPSFDSDAVLSRVKDCVLEVAYCSLCERVDGNVGTPQEQIKILSVILCQLAVLVAPSCHCTVNVLLTNPEFQVLDLFVLGGKLQASAYKALESSPDVPFAAKGNLSIKFTAIGLPTHYDIQAGTWTLPNQGVPATTWRYEWKEAWRSDGGSYIANPSAATLFGQLRPLDEEEEARLSQTSVTYCGFEVESIVLGESELEETWTKRAGNVPA